MFKILLPFFIFKTVALVASDQDLDRLSAQFSSVTRGSFVHSDLSESASLYELHNAAQGQGLSDFVQRRGSSDSDEDEEGTMILREKTQKEKSQQRQFDKKGLAHYIIHELSIDPVDLDKSSVTIIDQLNVLEQLINIHLKTLNDDLTHLLDEKSEMSRAQLMKPELIKRRYSDDIETIQTTLKLSFGSVENMLKLTFRYFILNVAGIFGEKCKISHNDLHSDWQLKYDLIQRNLSAIHSLFIAIGGDESKNRAMRSDIELILIPVLRTYYLHSCDYFEHWYKTKRSTWSQGLQLLGARSSNTKKIFDEFDTSFRTLFPFVLDNVLTLRDLNDRRSILLQSFDGTEKEFASNVSSVTGFLSWGTSSSAPTEQASSSVVVAPQPTKASSGWTSWWK